MWNVLVFCTVLFWFKVASGEEVLPGAQQVEGEDDKFGTNLVETLRNDANLDLPVDEEYEDLRAELLAYHTALAKLTEVSARRNMVSTECWKLGGICVNRQLCTGFRSLSEVAGCRNKHKVCCFTWNRVQVNPIEDLNLGVRYPWNPKNIGDMDYVIKEKPEIKTKGSEELEKEKYLRKKKKSFKIPEPPLGSEAKRGDPDEGLNYYPG